MKWGLVGASDIASRFMIAAIRAQDGHSIGSVLSADAERGRDYAKRHDIPQSTSDLAELIGDTDIAAVYISTTNEKHHAQAMAAIAAGKHVLCEKPLAMTVADGVEMVTAAHDKGVVFATNHHLRNAGSHLAIRDLISTGKVGKVLSARVLHAGHLPEHLRGWRISNAAAGGGVIPDIVVHDADIMRFHLGEDPVTVVAQAGVSGMGEGVEDSVMSVWSMPSGAMVQTHESFTHPFAGSGIEIHGTEGSIVARNLMSQRPIGDVTLINADGRHEVSFSDHDIYVRALALFAEAVGGRGRPAADGVDGVKSLAVALAVRQAAQEGHAVKIDYGGI